MADLKDVELARPGVWPLATGKTTFTVEHLRDAADFFQLTGGQNVPVALGHTDDKRFSGEPAFGSVTNIRFTEDDLGPVLLGDVVDMPGWLSAAAPKHWPNRSIEGWENFEYDGRTYKLILTGLAFLGAVPPAVRNIRSLRDLQVALAASAARRIVAMAPDETEPEVDTSADPPPEQPQTDTEAPAESGASSYPAPVTAVEAAARIHAAATRTTASPAEATTKGAGQMDPAKIREALGLAPDVSDDEVKTAAAAALGFVAQNAPPDPAPVAPKPELVQAGAAPGTIVLASSVYDEMQKTMQGMQSFVEKTKRNERDAVIAKAVEQGKFTPAQKPQFAQLWDADPDGTRKLIEDTLRPNSALAVMAMGYDGDGDDAFDREYADLFPPTYNGKGR